MIEQYKFVTKDRSILSPKEWEDLVDKIITGSKGIGDKSKSIVEVTWIFDGVKKVISVADSGYPFLLNDNTGIYCLNYNGTKKFKCIVVYNSDATVRFITNIEKYCDIDHKESACFNLIRFNDCNNGYECIFSDGDGDFIADINMKTGELTNVRTTRY